MRGYTDILGSVDSAFYYAERPETPMNLGALTIFDGTIAYEDLVRFVESRIPLCPRYAERIVQAPFHLGQPTWIKDPNFFVRDHIRTVHFDSPGDLGALRQLAGRLAAEQLDRGRPLWEIIMIEGLPGQTALLFKVHHCMVDGLAAVDLFNFLMDIAPRDLPVERRFINTAPALPGALTLLTDSVTRDLGHQFKLLRKIGGETFKLLGNLTHDQERLNMLVAVAHLISNNVKPIQKLVINGRNTGDQRLVWAEFALDDIHAIRARRKASVNEVMLTIMSRSVERYINDHGGTRQPFLRALVPFNVRNQEEKGEHGNRISVLPIDLPFGVADPLDHLAAVQKFSKVMKDSGLAFSMDLLLTLPSMLPAVAHKPIWGLAPVAFSLLAHTWCTNVAAPPIPVYLLGHELKQVFGFFPLNPSMGLASVIVSYNGHISITMVADEGILPDADILGAYANTVFGELCRAAGITPTPLNPVKAPVPAAEPPATPVAADPVPAASAQVEPAPSTAAPSAPAASAPAEPAAPMEAASAVPPVGDTQAAAPVLPTQPPSSAPAPLPAGQPPSIPFVNGKDASALGMDGHVEAVVVPHTAEAAIAAAHAHAAVSDADDTIEVHAAQVSGAAAASVAQPPVAPAAAVVPPSVVAPAPAPDSPPRPVAHKLFSPDWSAAMREAINGSSAYRAASTGWTAGALALVVEAAPNHGMNEPAGVLLDLYRGNCRNARSVTPAEAMRAASFVIQASYDAWMDALDGRFPPLVMLTTGRLSLKKGLMLRLLPFTKSATELVHCAQRVPLQR
ncbi:MAG: DUF1298 domain-containing protein [Chloroflexi bacterium]|nr:DUF1298 domain-containing protein [Chloroflexota bacterium]